MIAALFTTYTIYRICNRHATFLGSPGSSLIMSDSSSEADEQRQVFLLQMAGAAIVAAAAVVYAAPLYDKTLYHTSAYLVKIGCESSSNGHLDLVLPQTNVFRKN